MALKKNKLMIYTAIRMNFTNVILNNNKKNSYIEVHTM